MCVFNISPSSALGECIESESYDPWAGRQLQDFNKIKDKKDKKDNKKGKKQWKSLQQVN